MAPSRVRTPRWSYAKSGVDRTVVALALARLLREVRYRAPASHGRPLGGAGHYAGLLRLGSTTVALTTDTVGTKVLLARDVGRWEEVGEDVVGVNVNDLAAVGARPAALVDTILCARPDPSAFRAIGRGIDRGLRLAGCSLLGGETAVVPEIVDGIDLGGTALGFFPNGRKPVLGAGIRPGDRLLGIPSNGVHANGMTLVRRLLRETSCNLRAPRRGGRIPIGRELLRPTRIYTPTIDAIADRPEVHGLAHLSGGGVRNLVRLRSDVRFVLDRWPPLPGLFRWIASLGDLPDREVFETFNAGIGFVVVVAADAADGLRRRMARAGAPDAREIGRVERGTGVAVPARGLEYAGYS